MTIFDYKKQLTLDNTSILNRKTESPKIDALINLLYRLARYTGLFSENSIKIDYNNSEHIEKAKDLIDAILYFSKIYNTMDYNIFCYAMENVIVNPLNIIELTYNQQFKNKLPYAYDYELILKSIANLIFDGPVLMNAEKVLSIYFLKNNEQKLIM